MKKTKNDQSSKKPRTMLEQEVGSIENKKTNEDFNSVHPDHDDTRLAKDNSDGDEKNSTKKFNKKIKT